MSETVFYVAQERAFAPGIVKEWPSVVRQPRKLPNGRLVRVNAEQVREEVLTAAEKAAPDLLEALEGLVACLQAQGDELAEAEIAHLAELNAALEAIAKARGEG